ncbi:hypothetical protein GIB67_013758 [Kingdonia uniflora]|uniref:DUF1985 domain-containing protein n=1 Tax=Kingdonia uniflora TaxID=39325 RepID=A0A7J7MNC3_9MAGN|nr:hypothetical protein GIB67_013758 [Kingdonia uniflora]
MKPIHVCLILGLRVSPIANEFLFVNPEHMTNFRMRRFPKKKNIYGLKEIDDALKQAKLERHQEDVLRLNLLKIILSCLLPNKGRNVWVKYVDLVCDLQQFNKFPWGEQVYNFFWRQIVEFAKYQSAADKKSNKALSLHGCIWVLMIWTFISIPSLKFLGIEESIHLFPKLQGWRMTSSKYRQIVTFKKFFANPDLLAKAMKPSETNMQQDLVQEAMRNQIEAPAIEPPAVGAPKIGSSSSATEIGAVVAKVCSQLEEHGKMLLKLDDHGKMLHNHGKMLEQISMSTVGDTPLLGQYQLFTPEKITKHMREGGNEKEDGKRKKAEPRTKKGKEEWQKEVKEADVPNKKKKVVNDLMVDDDVEVGREVNSNAISFEYGGDLLEWKKGDKKDNDDKKDVEENVKSEEKQPQVAEEEEVQEMEESNNGDEKVDDVEKDEVAKTEIVFFNQEKVVGKAYQASDDQTTVASVEEQTIEVVQTEVVISHQKEDAGEASQSKESKEEVEKNKEEVVEGNDDDDRNSHNKPDLEQVIKEMVVDQTNV